MLKQKIMSVLKDRKTHAAAAFVAGAAVGFGGTYFGLRRVLETRYDARLDEEIEKTREQQRLIIKKDYPTPQSVKGINGIYEEIIESNVYVPTVVDSDDSEDDDEVDTEVKIRNVFEDEVTAYTPSETVQFIMDRNERLSQIGLPYPITDVDFFDNDLGYHETQLTWWPNSDLLLDDKEEIVYNADEIVGNENLELFVQLSQDGKMIYIRNDRNRHLYEISLETGDYDAEVAGFIEHSSRPGSNHPPKFRLED